MSITFLRSLSDTKPRTSDLKPSDDDAISTPEAFPLPPLLLHSSQFPSPHAKYAHRNVAEDITVTAATLHALNKKKEEAEMENSQFCGWSPSPSVTPQQRRPRFVMTEL